MLNLTLRGLAVAAFSFAALSAFATVYTDSTDDIAVGTFPHIDITSVTVTNTATDLTFVIDVAGSPVATNWGKYTILMRTPGATGDTSANGNGWGRPYSLDGGADKFIGGWADQATDNTQVWSFGSGAWSQVGAARTSTITDAGLSYTVPLADLGLSLGDVMSFDVVTTGGGGTDSAVDSLSNPNAQITSWGQTTVVQGQRYVVAAVPEPASFACLGLGALGLLRRRRK